MVLAYTNEKRKTTYVVSPRHGCVMVEADGTVRVYDSTAGHYTLCHGLTPRQCAGIRGLVTRRNNG